MVHEHDEHPAILKYRVDTLESTVKDHATTLEQHKSWISEIVLRYKLWRSVAGFVAVTVALIFIVARYGWDKLAEWVLK